MATPTATGRIQAAMDLPVEHNRQQELQIRNVFQQGDDGVRHRGRHCRRSQLHVHVGAASPAVDGKSAIKTKISLALPAPLASQGWLLRLHDPKEGVPYAVALAAAGLLVYPHTPFMAALGG